MKRLPPQREMERAIECRDGTYDGLFFVGVRSTGVFCRPSCKARTPLPKNRRYFATAREAIVAGFRPCKLCRPADHGNVRPAWVTRLLSLVEDEPQRRRPDAELRKLGIDPATARRYFLRHFGLTFQAYCRARRLGEAMQSMQNGTSIDHAAWDNGFDSPSGFRDAFARLFGDPPGRGRQAGCLRARWLETPLGSMVAVASERAVLLVEFSDRRALESQLRVLHRHDRRAIVPGRNQPLDQLAEEFQAYFAGRLQEFQVPIEYPGSPFQTAVWHELRRLAYGETCSYQELARRVGRPGAFRAVGRANGQNRLTIVVPCHRVVNKDGRLCGYGGGLWRKQYLLDLEQGRLAEPENPGPPIPQPRQRELALA